jgi:hypothetical protein
VGAGTGKKAEIWPYIPYNLVAHPYAAHTDKKAPPGYVRKVVASYGGGAGPGAQEERLTTMFSDDNPTQAASGSGPSVAPLRQARLFLYAAAHDF